MSGWPWMKDAAAVDAVKDGPIQIEGLENDQRLSVKDLIEEYRESIDQIKQELVSTNNELYDPESKHDDLWIVRFLMSHKRDIDKTMKAITSTLEFRNEHELDSKDIRQHPPQEFRDYPNPDELTGNQATVYRFMKLGGVGVDSVTLSLPDKLRGGSIFYFNIASIDTHKLGADVSQEDWLSGINYMNEWSFQWMDYITRTTGRLTKAVHFVDVGDIHFSQYDGTTQTKYTKAAHQMQDCYPQHIETYFVCNAPWWIEQFWKILKPLLPKRVVSKLDFVNPAESEEDAERLQQFIDLKYLPKRLGGKSEVWPPATFPSEEEPEEKSKGEGGEKP